MSDERKDTEEVKDEEVQTEETEVDQEETQTEEDTPVKTEEEIRAELEKQMQSQIDKRVTEAVKKTEERVKEELEEQRRLEKLSEEERKKEEAKKRAQEQARKEKELAKRELKLDLVDILAERDLSIDFKEFVDVSQFVEAEDSKEKMVEKVDKLEGMFNNIVEKKIEEFKKEYLKGETPEKLNHENNTPPNEYEDAKKAGDVKGMLKAKFGG
ncbi:MAG: hypothetical protein AWU54_1205 [Candidatus Frackibacter sp. T328-2]|jgi:type IV secretory pathway VirB10-like protein|nr:MAG: hypothetical protein AWU54_1205 [Candidatus Frackibacter sp. T328-2]